MTKTEIVNQISSDTGIGKIEVLKIVESLMSTVESSMAKVENVYLNGFGTFAIKERAEKTARNISKNTTIIIPAHSIPSFKPAKEFLGMI